MRLQPGSRIGPYEVRSLLGAGGMGVVYRAHDPRLQRDVALKTLPALWMEDLERATRFEREARILATLNHPNIATIHGFERDGSTLALVMELVEGETLEERLERCTHIGRGLPLAEVRHIARQIVAGLDAAHEKGIIHRDLKPANVKLTPDDEVKVLDFGLAKPFEDGGPDSTMEHRPAMTRTGIVVGTAGYMSPEQARGLPLDRRSDIWAFGCVLYEMLAGHPLFLRDTMSETLAAVLGAPIDVAALPADVPPALRKLVARCLERNLKSRLRDIADARLYLDEESPADVSGIGHAHGVTGRAGISRRAVLAGGAALGLLGAGGGAFVARRAQPAATPSYRRLTFRRGMIRTARFAPDFQTVLYGALWDGDVCRVYTVRPGSPESAPLSLPPATPLAVSASGELALALGTHFRGGMTYGTLARVPLAGGAPRELQEQVKYADWSPDGRDLAIVRRTGDRDQLEFPAGTVIAEPEGPRGGFGFPRVSPRGDAVAAFELSSRNGLVGRVVIVGRSGKRLAVSPVRYFNVFGLAWRGEEVWFTAAEELPLFRNAIYAMDMAGAVRLVTRVPGNTSLHDIAPDGRALIARTDDRSGFAVRAPGTPSERDLSWLDASILVDISRDGRRVLFTEDGVGGGPRASTYIRGTDGSPAVRLGDGNARALSPDGRWALVQTAPSHLDVIPTGAGQASRLERAGLKPLGARWLPDGKHVLLSAVPGSGPERVYLVGMDTPTTQPVTPEGIAMRRGAWTVSPDGAMVAVATGQRVELFAVDGSGATRQVPGARERSFVLGWTEQGLLVSDDPTTTGTVLLVDPVTGRRSPWADIRPLDPAGIMNQDLTMLVVTPDGQGYGYSWHRAMSDLYVVEGWA